MNGELRQCRLCQSDAIRHRLQLDGSPSRVQRLLDSASAPPDGGVNLTIYICEDCGFVQVPRLVSDDYYDDYVMTTSHSQQMQEYQLQQAESFVLNFKLAGKAVLEIGCGDGNYLGHLKSAGSSVRGIEPSYPFRQLALSRGFDVLDAYVTRGYKVPGGPYDAFVTRQVLEHVEDPNEFLLAIRENLSESGVGLVEVPSLEQALENSRFYDFFPDHLNYFSAHTLRHALVRNGFEVLEVSRGMGGEYNVALVRRTPTPDLTRLDVARRSTCAEFLEFVSAQRAASRRVALWGAGGKGLALLSLSGSPELAYVVDTDPHKQGKFTPSGKFPIYSPERLLADPVDAVVVTALAYEREILTQLRDLPYRGAIVLLGEHLRVAQV